MNIGEEQYLRLLENVIANGQMKKTRNGNTLSTFGNHLEFDLKDGLPLLTTKKVFLKGIFEELMWILKGDSNAKHLDEKGVKIWNQNTCRTFLDSNNLHHYQEGDSGELYSFNLRHFGEQYKGMNENYHEKGFDQLEYCLNLIKNDPFSRRIMLSMYNPATASNGVLYPCHVLYIFNVDTDNRLSCMMTMRSSDVCVGLPFNIVSVSLLVHFMVHVCNNKWNIGLIPGKVCMSLGDTHVYEDHVKLAKEQLKRKPKEFPKLKINKNVVDIIDFTWQDIEIIGYDQEPSIAYKMVA